MAEYIDIVKEVLSDATFRNRVGYASMAVAEATLDAVNSGSPPPQNEINLATAVIRGEPTRNGELFIEVVTATAQRQIPSITTEEMLSATDAQIYAFVEQNWSAIALGETS